MNPQQARSFLRNYYGSALGQPGSRFGSWQDIEDWLKGLSDTHVTAEADRLLFTLPVPEQDRLAGKEVAARWRTVRAAQAQITPTEPQRMQELFPTPYKPVDVQAYARSLQKQAPITPPPPSYVSDYPPQSVKIPRPQNIQTYDDYAAYRDEVYDYVADWLDANPEATRDERTEIWAEAGWLSEQALQDYKNRQGLAGAGGPQWRPGELELQQQQLGEQRRQFDVQHQLDLEKEKRQIQEALNYLNTAMGQMQTGAAQATLQARTQLAPITLPSGFNVIPGTEPGGLFNRIYGITNMPPGQVNVGQPMQVAQQQAAQMQQPMLDFLRR